MDNHLLNPNAQHINCWAFRTTKDKDHLDFVTKELSLGRLRQGWGYKACFDLRENGEEYHHVAQNIAIMRKVKKDDILLILNLPNYGLCTIAEATDDFYTGYLFDIPKNNVGNAPQDFGHIFPARIIKTIKKSDITDVALLKSINNCRLRFWSLEPYASTIAML
jgi:hypothetical protein